MAGRGSKRATRVRKASTRSSHGMLFGRPVALRQASTLSELLKRSRRYIETGQPTTEQICNGLGLLFEPLVAHRPDRHSFSVRASPKDFLFPSFAQTTRLQCSGTKGRKHANVKNTVISYFSSFSNRQRPDSNHPGNEDVRDLLLVPLPVLPILVRAGVIVSPRPVDEKDAEVDRVEVRDDAGAAARGAP